MLQEPAREAHSGAAEEIYRVFGSNVETEFNKLYFKNVFCILLHTNQLIFFEIEETCGS